MRARESAPLTSGPVCNRGKFPGTQAQHFSSSRVRTAENRHFPVPTPRQQAELPKSAREFAPLTPCPITPDPNKSLFGKVHSNPIERSKRFILLRRQVLADRKSTRL